MKIWHIVTKSSDDGTFMKGDHIAFLDDGSVLCREAEGWIDREDVHNACIGMTCKLHKESLDKKIAALKADIQYLEEHALT